MTDPDRDLRVRLSRLERAMPSAVPLDIKAMPPAAASSRWRLPAMLAAAAAAGVLAGAFGTALLDQERGQPTAPIVPAGVYRSAAPMGGPVCVALELPVRDTPGAPAFHRVWWWPQGPAGCGERADFVYVQWIQPRRVQITDGDDPRAGVRFDFTVELRDGTRHEMEFTLDPRAPADDDGTVPTFTTAGAGQPGIPLLPMTELDDIQEAP
jgi:hypothetical protein